MSEAAKALPLIADELEGKRVLDLGCGMEKVVPWAVGVDDCSENTLARPDVVAKVGVSDEAALLAKLRSLGLPERWPVVFSSHTIEHLYEPPLDNLLWWYSLVEVRGLLILYTPDERRYVYDTRTPSARNPGHRHLLTGEVVRWHLEQITGARIITETPHDYSTLHIVERMA